MNGPQILSDPNGKNLIKAWVKGVPFDPKAEARRVKALAKLYGSCPDFPAIESLPLPES